MMYSIDSNIYRLSYSNKLPSLHYDVFIQIAKLPTGMLNIAHVELVNLKYLKLKDYINI